MGAYSKEYDSRADAIVTSCDFYTADSRRVVHCNKVMWDTGSTTTILSRRLLDKLRPEPYRKGGMSGIGGDVETNTYLVHVAPPTGDVITYIEVMEHDFEDYDAIIGMDIITYGDFRVESIGGKTTFFFRLPDE